MSKTENAKKPRGKRTPSAEERLKDAIASCEERHRHWHELYANGTSDPFWADGVNLNLVHNHIRYYNKIIKECCDELGQDYPEVYCREIPQKVDPSYIAQKDRIVKDAKTALDKLTSHPSYPELLRLKAALSPQQLEKIFYPAVVGYVTGLRHSIEKNDYITMRRYRRYEHYIESFESCLQRAKELEPESFQLSIFDMMTA